MNILLVSPYDIYGGAEKIARWLAIIYHRLGHNVCLAVSDKFSDLQICIEIPRQKTTGIQRFFSKLNQIYSREDLLKKFLRQIQQPYAMRKIITGREKWNPASFQSVLDTINFMPDIVHFHNIRSRFPNLNLVQSAHNYSPIVITMHDFWLLTGKCIQPGRCDRWKDVCRHCPEAWFPSILVEKGIRKNLREKLEVISKIKPYVCAPSIWAMEIIKQSCIGKLVPEIRLVRNGVDTSVFNPGDKKSARVKTGLPADSFLILSSGRELKTNRYKNFKTLKRVAMMLGSSSIKGKTTILCLGDRGQTQHYGQVEIRFIPFSMDENYIADLYRGADVYVSTAEYETWGLTITESMACGTPVVAFSSSGIKEQIIDKVTGFLVPSNNLQQMTESIVKILKDVGLREKMSVAASNYVREHFNIENTASEYLKFYEEILNENKKNRN